MRPTKGTTAAGLGWAHQRARKAALAALVDGDPCPLCGWPMDRRMRLDLDHATPRVLGGHGGPTRLAHARCNRAAGAALGNRLRGIRRRGGHGAATRSSGAAVPRTSREW